MEPSEFSFTLKTHLHPIAYLLEGKETKSQVLFFNKASYSCCMAASQFAFSRACFTILGSEWVRNNEGCSLGFWIPNLNLVCMGCVLVGIELGAEGDLEEDLLMVVDSKVWGWTDVHSEGVSEWDSGRGIVGEWMGLLEKPGRTRGVEVEWEGDGWDNLGVVTIEGGDRLGLIVK